MKELNYYDLQLIDYSTAWQIQKDIFEKRKLNSTNDTLILLEHPHTYTLGKIAKKENLLFSNEILNKKNISIYEIDRGGDITYHGPGQIVGYPIIDLNLWQKDSHKYLRAIEEVIILTCKFFGLNTERSNSYTGVWIENRKIAAIGIKISRWITMHGFAFNINTDLDFFDGIIPCGINDENKSVTSLSKEFSKSFSILDVKEKLLSFFMEVFGFDYVNILPIENLLSENSFFNDNHLGYQQNFLNN